MTDAFKRLDAAYRDYFTRSLGRRGRFEMTPCMVVQMGLEAEYPEAVPTIYEYALAWKAVSK